MLINEGFTLSSLWSQIVGFCVAPTKNHCHCSLSQMIPDHDLHVITQDSEVLNEIASSRFHVGKTLLHSNSGRTSFVKVKEIFIGDNGILQFHVETSSNDIIVTTRESLRDPMTPDIGWIPSTVPDLHAASSQIPVEELEKIAKPVTLSPMQEEWLTLHERLWHLPFAIMFRLAQAGVLPKRFLKLRNSPPPCTSCLFGQAHRKPWRFKSTVDGALSVLRGDDVTRAGQVIGIDQLISCQPGLVPQEKGTMTWARVWAATIFVDYYTKFVYVALICDQTAKSAVEAKHNFEHFAATRSVQVDRYHGNNGVFRDFLFMDDVKKSMQQITFCGVNAHHQNGIVERTIKSLTLISRTLLLHAQRHWPEYITTMLWPLALKAAQD